MVKQKLCVNLVKILQVEVLDSSNMYVHMYESFSLCIWWCAWPPTPALYTICDT